jgi:hypothetical protein
MLFNLQDWLSGVFGYGQIQVNGTPQIKESTLNLIAGTGTTIVAADDPVNGVTNVTITVAASAPSVPLRYGHEQTGATIAISVPGQRQVCFVDSSGGSVALTCPTLPQPVDGQEICLVDAQWPGGPGQGGSWAAHPPTISPGGSAYIEDPNTSGLVALSASAIPQNGGKWLLTYDIELNLWHSD